MLGAEKHARSRLDAFTSVAALLLVLILAFGIRVISLDKEAVWSDEAFSWRVAMRPLPLMIDQVARDAHPPLYFFVLRGTLETFGTSPAALRLPSVLSGVGCVLITYLVCVEASRFGGHDASPNPPDGKRGAPLPNSRVFGDASVAGQSGTARWCGAILAAMYVAIHPLHVEASRTARMYSLAALLAGLSMWLLLRALQSSDHPIRRWVFYGVAAAMLLHTHNFGLFTVAAQATFVVYSFLRVGVNQRAVDGAIVAGVIVAAMYGPWLPFVAQQAASVRADFWINSLSVTSVAETLNSWTLGLRDAPLEVLPLSLLAITASGALGWCCQDRSIAFLVWQVVVPWICVILITLLFDRPLLLDRYLILSHIAFAATIGVMVARLANAVSLQALLIGSAALPTVVGCGAFLLALPTSRPSISRAARILNEQYRTGDVVVVPRPSDVNILRYYLSQLGTTSIPVMCPRPEPGVPGGHVMHVASLTEREMIRDIDDVEASFTRLFVVNSAIEPSGTSWFDPTGYVWNRKAMYTFAEMERSYPSGYQLSLFVPTSTALEIHGLGSEGDR